MKYFSRGVVDILSLIFFVSMLVVILIAYFFFAPDILKPDINLRNIVTSSTTYRNPYIDYSFSYPEKWTVIDRTEGKSVSVINIENGFNASKENKVMDIVVESLGSSEYSLSKYIEKAPLFINLDRESFEETEVFGNTGYIYEDEEYRYIVTSKLFAAVTIKVYKQNNEDAERILNTFDLKLHKNEK